MDPAPTAPRRRRGREQILTAATALFAERGYCATSMQHIADRLSVTKAALYRHVKSKQELLCAVTEPARTSIDALLAGDREPGSRSVERLTELLRALARISTEDTGAHVLVWRAGDGPDAVGREAVLQRITHLLERAAAEGDIRDDLRPALVAPLLLGVVVDVNSLPGDGRGDPPPTAVVEALLEGLVVRRPSPVILLGSGGA